MTIHVQIQDGSARMALPTRFDLQVYSDFKSAYMPLLDNIAIQEIELDFRWVAYIDSSALSMMLQLHESANKANKLMLLFNVSGIVLKVFDVANFSSMFNIRHAEAFYITERRSLGDRRAAFNH